MVALLEKKIEIVVLSSQYCVIVEAAKICVLLQLSNNNRKKNGENKIFINRMQSNSSRMQSKGNLTLIESITKNFGKFN